MKKSIKMWIATAVAALAVTGSAGLAASADDGGAPQARLPHGCC